MAVSPRPLVDRLLVVALVLVVTGAIVPWEIQKTATLAQISIVTSYGLVPSRLVVLGFTAVALAARRSGVSTRWVVALLVATAVSAVAVPGLHLYAVVSLRAGHTPGTEFYVTALAVFVWVGVLSYRVQRSSSIEQAALATVGLTGLAFAAALYHEVNVAVDPLFGPGFGFYATALSAPVFAAAAAISYFESREAGHVRNAPATHTPKD